MEKKAVKAKKSKPVAERLRATAERSGTEGETEDGAELGLEGQEKASATAF